MSGRKNSNILAVLFAAMLVLALYAPAPAETHYVNPGQSIQAAIDAASNGDEIEVAPGIYFNQTVDFKGKAIVLGSTDPNDPSVVAATIITGPLFGGSPVVKCVSGEDANTVLNGFTICGGAGGTRGGGMYCENSSPMANNCTFSGNTATYGGGMYNLQSSPTVTNCTFSGNTAKYRGGGMYNYNSSPAVANCIFTGNSNTAASDTYGGGAMYNSGSSPAVTNCTFSANTAATNGGAIYNYNSSNPTVTNCTFTGNAATCENGLRYAYYEGTYDTVHDFDSLTPVKTGTAVNFDLTRRDRDDNFGFRFTGYIYIQVPAPWSSWKYKFYLKSDDGSKLYIDGAEVVDNDGVHGSREEEGTISLGPGPHIIKVLYFNERTAYELRVSWAKASDPSGLGWGEKKLILQQDLYQYASNGAGLYNYNSSPTVTNCTFSQNTANFNGGGMYCESGSPTVTNCIFWGDEPDEIFDDGASSTDVTYSNVQGAYGGAGNIHEDPLFVNAPNGDLRLGNCSPCADAGNNYGVPADLTTDLDANPRFVDDANMADTGSGTAPIVDMGAYERQISSVPPIFNVTRGIYYFEIQAAIDEASNGDEIEVAPGTYNEAIDFEGKAVRLYSSSGPEVTTIDGAGHYHVVQCVSGEGRGTILEGFTITGGNASGSGTDGYGGGMYCKSASSTVTNCNFSANEAVRGGGMFNEASNPTVINCTFSGNSASWNGGGMYNITNSSPTLTNCVFTGNTAASDTYGGGAIFNHTSSNPALTNCTFAGNAATTNGGAIYNYNSSNPALTNCIFTANAAACQNGLRYEYYEGEWDNLPNFDALTPVKTGTVANFNLTPRNRDDNFGFRFTGYIYVQYPVAVPYAYFFYLKSDDGSKLYIDGAEVVDNDGLHGSREEIGVSVLLPGAHKIEVVYFEKSSAQVLEVSWSSSWWQKKLISQQDLYPYASNGAGMYNYNSSPTLTNCTFSQNTANFNGGGMYCESGSPTVTNCIFWGDEPDEIFDDGASSTDVTYSNVQVAWPGTGNIAQNPLLRNLADGDLSLAPWSPCIDVGNNDVVPPGATDIAGLPRLVDGDCDATAIVDMGAHEFGHAYGGDFDSSCLVNWADYAVLASAWLGSPLSENWEPACDIGIPADRYIDCNDLNVLAGNWLRSIDTAITCDANQLRNVFGLDAAAIFEILAAAPCSFSEDEILTNIAQAGCPMLELVEIDADPSGQPVIPPGYHALGSYSFTTAGCQFAARELLPGVLASPEDYSQSLTDYWRPVPPTGYVSLGLVEKSVKPGLNEVKCVKRQLALPGLLGARVEPEKPYPKHIVPHPLWTDGMNIGTFETLPPSLHVLDARVVQKPEYLTLQEVDQLIRDYGPVLKFHPEEDYYPDDPEWVLDNGVRLQWGLVEDANYDVFSQTYVDSRSTSSATLVDDVAYVVNNIKPNWPYYSSGLFKYWLNIPDALKPGDLARAKSLVRVVPWNHFFTEIQFWFFYPFNGPGRVEPCAYSGWCERKQLSEAGRHYGDWEHVTLRFVNSSQRLVSVYMSAHSGGQWFGVGDFGYTLQFQDSHPIVYSAKYSHAHYPTADFHPYERVFSFKWGGGTASADLYDLTDNGFVFPCYVVDNYHVVSYDVYPVHEPDWLKFEGRWGKYEKLKDEIEFLSDLIPVYTYKEVGRGPTGPPQKRAWQVGISGEELGY